MAKHTPHGTSYSTDDLIRMANMGNFGNQYSVMLRNTLVRHKQMELEIRRLNGIIAELEDAQALQAINDSSLYGDLDNSVEEVQGNDLPNMPEM